MITLRLPVIIFQSIRGPVLADVPGAVPRAGTSTRLVQAENLPVIVRERSDRVGWMERWARVPLRRNLSAYSKQRVPSGAVNRVPGKGVSGCRLYEVDCGGP